jgi:hypothetical protein
MNDQTNQNQPYMISIYEPEEANGAVIFTFVPKGLQYERGPGGTSKRVPQYIVEVREKKGKLMLDWNDTPDKPGMSRKQLEAEVVARMKDRTMWIHRVNALVADVEQWAREMGWSTRRIEKKLDDARIGKHRVPALLMQEDTCRILLEPVGRSAPGAEGVVDLYLMPAYDDIASLYYAGNQWNLHYLFPGEKGPVREAKAMPLSKKTFEKVLGEMRQNAA